MVIFVWYVNVFYDSKYPDFIALWSHKPTGICESYVANLFARTNTISIKISINAIKIENCNLLNQFFLFN